MVVDLNDKGHLSSVVASECHDGKDGEYIVFTYSDGRSDSVRTTLFHASQLAESEGLILVPTSDETFRWERP